MLCIRYKVYIVLNKPDFKKRYVFLGYVTKDLEANYIVLMGIVFCAMYLVDSWFWGFLQKM